jgi:hypothetical protein
LSRVRGPRSPWPRRAALACALVAGSLALAAAAPAASEAESEERDRATATIEIVNRTRWWIYELYLSPTRALDWGPDQLGDETIGPGDHFTLSDIPCQVYDVRLVDEDGDECVVVGIDLCAGDYEWVIENDALLACQES